MGYQIKSIKCAEIGGHVCQIRSIPTNVVLEATKVRRGLRRTKKIKPEKVYGKKKRKLIRRKAKIFSKKSKRK
jgi:hypothetical protein